ncbi:MAG: DUF523 domain-containing protein [Mariprofundus sp.]|nr:DUF523 domain-containing protein [Mariprofundus sp.]
MNKILISACLLGENVRYDGSNSRVISELLEQWRQQGRIMSTCPEMAGGLPVPRQPSEIDAGNAEAVLRGKSAIRRIDGLDVTDAYLNGAEKTLALCMQHNIRIAILKEGSPSCGVLCVNDGSFSSHKIDGQGVTARLLTRHGISVFNEIQISDAAMRLNELETCYNESICWQSSML